LNGKKWEEVNPAEAFGDIEFDANDDLYGLVNPECPCGFCVIARDVQRDEADDSMEVEQEMMDIFALNELHYWANYSWEDDLAPNINGRVIRMLEDGEDEFIKAMNGEVQPDVADASDEETSEEEVISVPEDDMSEGELQLFLQQYAAKIAGHQAAVVEIVGPEKCFKCSPGENDLFIVDTGCKRMHICMHEHMLRNLKSTNIKIQGITSDALDAAKIGWLPLVGRALYVPNADANLISVRQLIELYGGYFIGNKDNLIVFDKSKKVLLKAKTRLNGFWTITYGEILLAAKARPDIVKVYRADTAHFTAEERRRALEAFNLCAVLGHPGTETLKADLDNNCYPNTYLVGKDLENARIIYGECEACLEGKFKAPSEPSSNSPPASTIGEHVHADLHELKEVTLGGNTQLLVAVDEKSGYIVCIGLKTKRSQDIMEGWEHIMGLFNSYGHKIKTITTDNEPTLMSTKTFLGKYGILLTSTPTGLHQKRAERNWQTIQDRARSAKAHLKYEWPHYLDGELYKSMCDLINRSSNSASDKHTPEQLFTGKRSTIPSFYIGQVVLALRKNKTEDKRAEPAIYIGESDTHNSHRVYIPTVKEFYSVRKCTALNNYPAEWGLTPRLVAAAAKKNVFKGKELPVLGQPMGIVADEIKQTLIDYPEFEKDAENALPNSSHQEGILTLNAPVQTQTDIPPTTTPTAPHTTPTNTPTTSIEPEPEPQPIHDIPVPTIDQQRSPPATKSQRTKKAKPTIAEPQTEQEESTPDNIQSQRPRRKAAMNKGWIHGRYFTDTEVVATLPSIIHEVYRISLKSALKMKDRQSDIRTAIADEIRNILGFNVATPIHSSDIPIGEEKLIIPSHMFLKFKYKADGSFDKVKARLVANGNFQAIETIDETYSPTVNPISVFTQLNITVCHQLKLSAHDMKGAFLNTRIEDGKRIYIILGPEETAIWISVIPEHAKFVDEDGCMTLLLLAYIYGLPEASNRFNVLMNRILKSLGFKQTKADKCFYYLKRKNRLMLLSLHVDDILLSSPTEADEKWFIRAMEKEFELVSQFTNVSYLGMSITYDTNRRLIKATQDGYVQDIVKKYGCNDLNKFPPTPCTSELLKETDENDPAPAPTKREFLSLIMSLMFVARFTRPDILFCVTVLATKSANPAASDMRQGIRIVKYLAADTKVGPVFDGNIPMEPAIHADASHASHPKGHSHAGIIAGYGSAPVLCKSYKIKSICRASSESELYVYEEGSTYAVWLKALLTELELISTKTPITLYQDNQSTIIIGLKGANFKRTRHLVTRDSFIKERIERGDIDVKYCPSEEMVADFLTKPLTREKLRRFLTMLNIY
jgi:hypothetical protein